MALNFPNSPALNDVYTDTVSGFSYQWNGTVWISFSAASSNQIKIIDDISGSFNGIGKTFALAITGSSISPPSPQSLLITLGGVTQEPVVDYTISTSNIVFNEAPEAALAFSGISLGPAIPLTTIPDGTVTAGSFTVTGILSTSNLLVSGISTFIGLATHTGTIFGSNLSLTGIATASTFRVGTAVTINSSGITVVGVVTATTFVGALTGTATTTTNIPNLTGAITSANTATSLGSFTSAQLATALTDETGSGSNVFATSPTLVTPVLGAATATSVVVGSGVTINTSGIIASGIITATSFVGSGANLTNLNIPASFNELDVALFS